MLSFENGFLRDALEIWNAELQAEFSTEVDVAAGGSMFHKRAQLVGASVALVHVNVKVDATSIDAVVFASVEDGHVGSVVHTSLSTEGEAKFEKYLQDYRIVPGGNLSERNRV